MSTNRRGPSAYSTKLVIGPAGRPLCRWCRTEVPKGRRTFCSAPCVDEWKIRSDPGHAAALVFRRDCGICAICGLDTAALSKRLRAWMYKTKRLAWEGPVDFEGRRTPTDRTLWEADHVVPVSKGGGECGLAGYRTLCLWCHRRVTADLRRVKNPEGSRQRRRRPKASGR